MAANTSFFKDAGISATLQTTFAQSVTQAEAAKVAAEEARDASVAAKNLSVAAKDEAETAETNAETAETNAETAETNAGLSRADAVKLATNAHNSQYTLSNSSTGYSALHYATETAASVSTAAASATTASQWASLTTGLVASTDYSSKAYAIGGTGVTSQTGPAKDWAIKTNGAVDSSSEYSAKEYAIGSTQSVGSAKQWSIGGGSGFTTATAVAGGLHSAKYYAEAAQSAASNAEGSLTSFQQVYLGSGSSDPSSGHTSGDIFFNTAASVLKYFNGSAWIPIQPGGASVGEAIAFSIAL
ncbi:hypothetical protein OAP51_05805 [Alphaproteobacteria bacterium]|nr:hypothetical protein [Alphaproteobacteria bacterium]